VYPANPDVLSQCYLDNGIMSAIEIKHRRAQAIIREAITSTEFLLYDAHGNPISLRSPQPGGVELEKVRAEIYKIVDEHLAKICPEDLADPNKVAESLLQSLKNKKTGGYVFDITKGELSVPFPSGTQVGLKYTIPVYKLLGGVAAIASLNLPKWLQIIGLTAAGADDFRMRGDSRYENGELSGALDDYTEAIRLNPGDADAFQMRGNIRYQEGDLRNAIEDYNEAIRLNPENRDAFYNRGNARYVGRETSEDLARAIGDFDEVIRLDPADSGALNMRCFLRFRQAELEGERNFEAALQDCNAAIRLNPDDAYAFKMRGCIRYEQGDQDGALQDYSEAIRLDPEDGVSYFKRSRIRSVGGDIEGALKDMKEGAKRVRGVSDPQLSNFWIESKDRISHEVVTLPPRTARRRFSAKPK
jgi:tetratricopeptide (TPR) repeat protein